MMKKLLILGLLALTACTKAPKYTFERISTTPLRPSEVHNPLLEAFDLQYDLEPVSFPVMVDRMTPMAGDEYFQQRAPQMPMATHTIDESLQMMVDAEQNPEMKQVMQMTLNFSGTGDIVAAARNGFSVVTPEVEDYLDILEGSLRSVKKRGQIGILQTPQIPMKSDQDKIAAADAAGYRYEFTVAQNQGASFQVAMYRGALMAALVSAAKERELNQ